MSLLPERSQSAADSEFPARSRHGCGLAASVPDLPRECLHPSDEAVRSPDPLGGVRTRFFPWTISLSGAGCSILTPKARIALTVRMQSSLARNPRRVHTPLDK